MLDLKALEQALQTVSQVGKGELTFYVNGLPIVMRLLLPQEDQEAITRARDGDDLTGAIIAERYKRNILGYSIVQIGDMDLRNEDFIATGEMTEKGVAVRIPRHVAVCKIVDGWASSVTVNIFAKYYELSKRADLQAANAIQYDAVDLDAEIAHLKKRLEDLIKEREAQALTSPDNMMARMEAVTSVDLTSQQRLRQVAVDAGLSVSPEPVASAQPPRAEIPPAVVQPTPVAAPAETAPTDPTPAPAVPRQRILPPKAVAPPPMEPTQPSVPQTPPTPFEAMSNSMDDSEEALALETQRLQQARMAARKTSRETLQQAEAAVIPGSVGRRVAPHLAAANVANAMLDTEGNGIEPARPNRGAPGAPEAVRMPPQTLYEKAPAPPPKTAVVNQGVPKTNNPRFQGKV